jgi:hypothetical protein
LEADAGLLAIVTNVDAHFELFHDNPLHCSLDLPLELVYIDGLATLMTDQ